MTVSTSNGMLAVIQALAASMTAGAGSQGRGLDDLSTSDFMKVFSQKLAAFHGNMAQIEAYIQSYLTQHAVGTSLRDQMSTGSVLALGTVSDLLGNLKDYDSKIADAQKKVDASLQAVADNASEIANVASQMDYGALFSHYMHKYWYLGPAAWASFAAADLACLSQDLSNLNDQSKSLTTTLTNDQNELASLQKAQNGLLSNGTGNMEAKGGSLAGPAQAALDTAEETANMSLMFLESYAHLASQA